MKMLIALVLTAMTVTANAQWDRDGRRDDRRRDDRRGGERITCILKTPNYRFVSTRRDCRDAYADVLNDCYGVARESKQVRRCQNAGYPDSKYKLDCVSDRNPGFDLFPTYCR